MSKFTEFLDTFFFVLRKKNHSISVLHVVHHSIMPAATYFGVKFVAGGHGSFFGLLNTFVHIFMYSYYLLAALGPKYQKFLWWKKYLTVMFVLLCLDIKITIFFLLAAPSTDSIFNGFNSFWTITF